jgi:hypothetical protein
LEGRTDAVGARPLEVDMGSDVEKGKDSGLRLADGVVLVAVGVVGVLVAFWLLSVVAGFVWGLVKLVFIVALVAGAVTLLLRRRRS